MILVSDAMRTEDFDYLFPPELVATEPNLEHRILWARSPFSKNELNEISQDQLLELFSPGDALVINNSLVLPRRIITEDNTEILFIEKYAVNSTEVWQVLFPAKTAKVGDMILLPGGIQAKLIGKGLPQKLAVQAELSDYYFRKYGELALPPYIQKARNERHNRSSDKESYQTAWAKEPGSLAAPTASLHFSANDIQKLRDRGVLIVPLTLHIGLGTFLPMKSEQLEDHEMHSEWISISKDSAEKIIFAKSKGRKIWALGTTVVRSLESWGRQMLSENPDGDYSGFSKLFIYPGYKFEVVDNVLTNFHQPKSTLLALISAYAGLENVKHTYQYAIENKFRLFSYGDLSVWTK